MFQRRSNLVVLALLAVHLAFTRSETLETTKDNSTNTVNVQEKTVGVSIGVKNTTVDIVTDPGRKEPRWSPESRILTPSTPWKGPRTSHRKDSYLEALRHSRTSDDPREGIVRIDSKRRAPSSNRREYSPGPVYVPQNEYGVPKDPERGYLPPNNQKPYDNSDYNRETYSISPSDSYALPGKASVSFKEQSGVRGSFEGPRITYGPPKGHHQNGYPGDYYPGPPQQGYGSPAVSYGAPYGLQEVSHHIELPHLDLSWPLALKLNAFTLAKILLKLVIFKMIVKFIAVICLLLFIPKLEIIKKKGNKGESDEDDEESRGFLSRDSARSDKLNLLTSIVLNSYEKYDALNSTRNSTTTEQEEEYCGIGCRVRKALGYGESWMDYKRLLQSYVLEQTKS